MLAAILSILVLAAPRASFADLAGEPIGQVAQLPERPGPHWFWISDILLHRTALFDGDSGRLLGTISSGTAGIGFVIYPLFGHGRGEIYLAETYYSRGVRGDRTDVVTVYDARTLQPKAEIPIPAKRGEYFPGNASNALTDDERFMAVFNITPATSVSIVDVETRKFTAEIETPGCSLLFSAGPRRFFLLCANGGAMVINLDEQGREAGIERTEPFFDAQKDPLTEKAVRRGNEWIFVSYDGVVHTVSVGGDELAFGKPWPLLSDADREDSWRIGGLQHLAVHAATGKLYVLMHQGPRDTHKDPGTEVWVYDMPSQRRIARLELGSPLVSFLAEQGKLGHESTSDRFTRWVLGAALPHPGIERILVTQDPDPVLVVSSGFPPTISVLDADTGELRREITEPGIGFSLLFAP